MLDSKQGGTGDGHGVNDRASTRPDQSAKQAAQGANASNQNAPQNDDFDDDDIPF